MHMGMWFYANSWLDRLFWSRFTMSLLQPLLVCRMWGPSPMCSPARPICIILGPSSPHPLTLTSWQSNVTGCAEYHHAHPLDGKSMPHTNMSCSFLMSHSFFSYIQPQGEGWANITQYIKLCHLLTFCSFLSSSQTGNVNPKDSPASQVTPPLTDGSPMEGWWGKEI